VEARGLAEQGTPRAPANTLRRVLAPVALAQFICSFAGSNLNVMINDKPGVADEPHHGPSVPAGHRPRRASPWAIRSGWSSTDGLIYTAWKGPRSILTVPGPVSGARPSARWRTAGKGNSTHDTPPAEDARRERQAV
jgi:hypothetical protein